MSVLRMNFPRYHFSRHAGILLAALVGLSLIAPAARASLAVTVTPTITAQAGGFLYSYSLAVLPTSTLAASEFDLDISGNQSSMGIMTPVGAPLTNITMPNGFINLYTPGDPTISFFSTGASTDIQPGSSGVFSFNSPDAPVLQDYQVTSFDGSGGTTSGQVLSPSPLSTAVPEASSLALLALGLLPLALCVRRRMSRRAIE